MNVVAVDTADRRQVAQYLRLPFDLYRATPQWVPPLVSDVKAALDRRRNPFYRHGDAIFLLASDGGHPVGRLALLDNANYNAANAQRTAFFCHFECIDSLEAAVALFDAGVAWATGRGLTKAIGPRGFTALDGLGMLVKGFEHRPAFGLPYNHRYYPELLVAAGFAGVGDIVSGYLNRDVEFPERIHRLSELVQQRRGLRVANFRSRRELRAIVPRLKGLYNGSLGTGDGNIPLDDADAQGMVNQMLWFVDPKLIKVIFKRSSDGIPEHDEPVGFLFAYPDVSAALQRTGGRLFPFGWVDVWRELKRTEWVNINGAAIIEKYRGLGGTAILFSEMYKSFIEGRYVHADLVQIGADNDRMLRELRDLGVDFYKTHRMYERVLQPRNGDRKLRVI